MNNSQQEEHEQEVLVVAVLTHPHTPALRESAVNG